MSPTNNTQKRVHVTSTKSEGKEGGSSTEAELGHSGGGGGGGTGAGSIAGAENEEDIDDLASEAGKGKGGIDSSKVHPGSVGGDKEGKGGKRDSKL